MMATREPRPSLIACVEGSGLMDCVECGLLAFTQKMVLENCDWFGIVVMFM